jgi:1-acyl-sn-glycerol-3-phosphate acyltransferase
MIDQARLDAIHLSPVPRVQKIFATLGLMPNYNWPGRRTNIILEGTENVPREGGSVFVMNHTDRYNYWPFQYALWRHKLGYTATWVKGKYYENPLMAWFMDVNNNIPIPSKGYVLTKDFQSAEGRPPENVEYTALKQYADGKLDRKEAMRQGGPRVAAFLNRPWGANEDYAVDLERRFRAMMQRVVEINKESLDAGLNLLIFPQGTRSVRLTRGHTGAAQVILHTGAPVIPVGCNGSDKCYRGSSPISKGGRIVYRIGKPLTVQKELKPFRIKEPFVPFTDSAAKFEPVFRKVTDLMMDRINDLLDPEYQYADNVKLQQGAKRFL